MSGLRVALDLDSTLAATCDVAFDLICGPDHDYGYTDIESWNWGLEEFGEAQYLNALWHAWTLRREEIEPMTPEIALDVHIVRSHPSVDAVDIVTRHPDHLGITTHKVRWLDEHDIPYDDFVRADETKAALDYDVYIDDDPRLAGDVADRDAPGVVVLVDRRYNRDASDEHYRVTQVMQAAEVITGVSVGEWP